jgi:hypothetical protein
MTPLSLDSCFDNGWEDGGGGFAGLDGYDYDVFAGGQLSAGSGFYTGGFFDEYYPGFEPYENPFVSTPPFYNPGMSSGQQQSWIDKLIEKGINAGEQFVRAYVGKVTSKTFIKFLTEVYPYAFAQAKKSGLPQLCFWFGDVLRVMPDGKWGMVYENIGDLEAYKRYLNELAKRDYFQSGFCPHGSEDIPLGLCTIVTYGSPANKLFKAGGGSGVIWLALAGAAIYFAPKLLRGLK